jgi:hypothetical protein
MNRVFISYRREDTAGFARSLFLSLKSRFDPDQIFMDVEDIEPGLDFVDAIDRSLASCKILLVLMGTDWATCVDSRGRKRLDDPNDFVRIEVAAALRRNVRVIPVLVKGAKMPRAEELPEELRSLTRRQALELRHNYWDSDVNRLIDVLEKTIGSGKKKHVTSKRTAGVRPEKPPVAVTQPQEQKPLPQKTWRKKATILFAAVIVVMGIAVYMQQRPAPHPPEYTHSNQESRASSSKYPVKKIRKSKIDYPVSRSRPSREMVLSAQQWLSELGYSPGPADGKAGPRTIDAVRTFQRDSGMEPDGRIDQELLDRIEQAISAGAELDRIDQDMTGKYDSRHAVLNLSGKWQDESGIVYAISHQGNMIHSVGYTVAGVPIGEFRGIINGNILEYTYRTAAGTAGYGEATISPDGLHMQYRAIDTVTGMQETGNLHKIDY